MAIIHDIKTITMLQRPTPKGRRVAEVGVSSLFEGL